MNKTINNHSDKTDFAGYLQGILGIFADKQQFAAITCAPGVNIIISGPGSGKSTVIAGRLIYLNKVLKINMSEVTVLAFNKAAKNELLKRMSKICETGGIDEIPHICTIHSLAYKIVRKYCEAAGSHAIIDESRCEAELERLYKKNYGCKDGGGRKNGNYSGSGGRKNGRSSAELRKCLIEYENRLLWDDEKTRHIFDAKYDGFCDFYEQWLEKKRKSGVYDFDGVQLEALRLLRANNANKKCFPECTHILLDEAQDITALQFEMIRAVLPAGGELFIVGDDDQCIYSFRFAEAKYIIEPEKYFDRFGKYEIGTNYRSSKIIVETASKFIKKNICRVSKSLTAVNSDICIPEVKSVARSIDQNRLVADTFTRLRSGESMGVIYRNNISAIPTAHFLLKKGIPVRHIGQLPDFFRNAYVVRMLSEVRAYTMKCGMTGRAERGNREAPDALLRHIEKSKNIYGELTGKAVAANDEKVSFEVEREVLAEIAVGCGTVQEFLNTVEQLREIFADSGNMRTAQKSISEQAEVYRHGEYKKDASLTLVSAHSSKGLEFDCTVIIDVNKGIFPAAADKAETDEQAFSEAERRLFYVAMTRAKKRLIIVAPQRKIGKVLAESEFASELREILKKQGQQDKVLSNPAAPGCLYY